MFCKNCGKQLPDSAKFCSGCGTPVTPAAPPAPPDEAKVQKPEASSNNTAAEEISEVSSETAEVPGEEAPKVFEAPTVVFEAPTVFEAAETFAPPDPPEESAAPSAVPTAAEDIPAPVQRHRGRLAVIGLGAVVVVVLAVVLFKLISGMIGGEKRAPAFAYLNNKHELMYLSNLKKKTDAIEVTDEANDSARVQFTVDGKTMYFRDDSRTLYKIAVSDLKKDGRPERIARDVTGFTVLKTGNVLYTTDGSRGTELNCHNGKDDFRITRGYDSYQLSEDEKTVYYTVEDEDDGTLTLCKSALREGADQSELLDGATVIYTDFDADLLVYGEDKMSGNAAYADDVDRNTLTIYSCKPGGEPTELVDDIYGIGGLKVDGGKVSFYYTTDELEQYTLYDLVSDPKQSADAAATAQELIRPDWYSTYYPDKVYEENGAAYYQTSQGEVFPVDTNELQASTGLPVAELYYYDVYNIAYAHAQDRYNADMEEYNGKYDEWNAANNRNQIRESLKNERYIQHSGSIYHYTGSADSDPIATNIDWMNFVSSYSDGNGLFLYKKAVGVTGGKVCDVADLNYYGEVYNYLNSTGTGGEWYQNAGGVESTFDLDEEVSVSSIYVLNGKEAVLYLSEDGDSWLDAYTVGDTALTFSGTVIDDEFSGLRRGTDTKGNDVLYFFTNLEEEDYGRTGDFNRYSGGKTEILAEGVYSVCILDDSGTMYAVTDWDRNGAELSLLQGDKSTVINDEMDDKVLIFLDIKQVLYTADGDLYLWNGKESRRIAKNVEYVWANAQETYTVYSPNN